MKKIILLLLVLVPALSLTSIAQKKLFHDNGKLAYDSTFHTVFYSTGERVYNPRYNTVYYNNGKEAYRDDYKNIYYANGSIAFNAMTKNLYYSNGNVAYDGRSKTGFTKESKDGQNLQKNADGGYSIEEEGLKVNVDKFNQFKFELVLQDVGFFYVTDFKTYFAIKSGTVANSQTVCMVNLN